jgi:Family of unknown function (DUF5343)
MALPTSYLTSGKNLSAILDAIKEAQAPDKFTTRFLESLDFKSATDRLIIGVLKSLGLLDDVGKPTDRYFRFLDKTQSASVLAEGIQEAYEDLFKTNTNANKMSKQDVMSKFKTLSQGQLTDVVNENLARTFVQLCALADFEGSRKQNISQQAMPPTEAENEVPRVPKADRIALGGLHYNIQLILPESRDPKVYDVLFRSLKEHLF